MIRLESFADPGPELTRDDSKPISPSSVNAETVGNARRDNSVEEPISSLAVVVTPPIADPIKTDANPTSETVTYIGRHSLLKLESYCEDSPPTSGSESNQILESKMPAATGESSDKPVKNLDSLIGGSIHSKNQPSRRRTYDDEPPRIPTRRRSVRDKIFTNIIDYTFGIAIGHVANGVPAEVKYEPAVKKPPPTKPPKSKERRSSFGDAQTPKRRGSMRDKIIGHIIQAAVMGVGHNDQGDKNNESQSGLVTT